MFFLHAFYFAVDSFLFLFLKKSVTQWGGQRPSESVYYAHSEEIDENFRKLEKIHCEGVIAWWIFDGQR